MVSVDNKVRRRKNKHVAFLRCSLEKGGMVLIFAMAFLLLNIGFSSGQGKEAMLSIRMNFDDGKAEGWMPIYGVWKVEKGHYRAIRVQDGGAHLRQKEETEGALPSGAIAFFGKPNWQDYRVSIRVLGGTDVPNLLLRVKDAYNCIQFGHFGPRFRLYLFKGGKCEILKEINRGFRHPEKLEAEIAGNRFRGYVDGELIIEYIFPEGAIPDAGKVGVQTNHSLFFDDFAVDVYRIKEGMKDTEGKKVEIASIAFSHTYPGLREILVRCRDSAGIEDIEAVHPRIYYLKGGETIELSTNPLALEEKVSPTEGIWVGDLFSMAEGLYSVEVTLYDVWGNRYTRSEEISVTAKPNAYRDYGEKKIYHLLDPDPVWRNAIDHKPSIGAKARLYNYLWCVVWGKTFALYPFTLKEQPPEKGSRYGITTTRQSLGVFPMMRDRDGRIVEMEIKRKYVAYPVTKFHIRPVYEVHTAKGELKWWTDVWMGNPVLRFQGELASKADDRIAFGYRVEGFEEIRYLIPTLEGVKEKELGQGGLVLSGEELSDNWVLFHPTGISKGPVFLYCFSARPLRIERKNGKDYIWFAEREVEKREIYRPPLLSISVVDAFFTYSGVTSLISLAEKLAHSSLNIPEEMTYEDLGLSGEKNFRERINVDYTHLENDWDIPDEGLLIAIPWAAGKNTSPAPNLWIHTAFGRHPFVITREKGLTLNLPVPDLSLESVAPQYSPLTGDWLRKASECIEHIYSLQKDDGTFERYGRMDHYSLGRITFGLMIAYPGLRNNPRAQEEIRSMVRKSLGRMMGEKAEVVREEMKLEKHFTGGAEKVTWGRGKAYRPFVYSPKWDVYTEMGGFVDQNLGHAHLFFTLLLYGKYVDPGYVRRPDIRDKIEELIRFQWLSQDWNGDIWRVFEGGVDAAGGGDGFEEDLAMCLPALAKLAGLDKSWVDLSYRIAALKCGALRNFDYLFVDNEWGFETLTPIHHPWGWQPDGGANLNYRGDIWWTGPSISGGYYGRWYMDAVYNETIFRNQWYRRMEGYKDVSLDGRHWCTVGAYCSEAHIINPYLGAVKLMRAYKLAKEKGWLTEETRGELIWNFCFYPAAMVVINEELLKDGILTRKSEPIDGAVFTPDWGTFPAYAWKDSFGAVLCVIGYRIEGKREITLELDTGRLGLNKPSYWLVDLEKRKIVGRYSPSQIKQISVTVGRNEPVVLLVTDSRDLADKYTK